MGFIFTPSPHFVSAGYEKVDCDFDDDTNAELVLIRSVYPELSDWGGQAIESAWSSYSEQCFLISWVYWDLDKRDDLFLSFCAWEQIKGRFPWGGDICELSEYRVWVF